MKAETVPAGKGQVNTQRLSGGRELCFDRKKLMREKPGYRFFKRAQDILLSLIGIILLLPFGLILSLIIWLDDPHGSPIFIQDRVGQNGKVFRFYKFRSMSKNAEAQRQELEIYNEMDGPVFKIRNDPRVTRVGRFIRKTSIDELPQLINVLLGDMSLVGPRPPLVREVVCYDEYQAQRLYIRPGLTCYWQVTPFKNDMSFEEWVALDLKYIRERSTLVDWKIILRTIGVVFRMYGV